jgi:hypothetical protein
MGHGKENKKRIVKMFPGCRLQPLENRNVYRRRANSTAPIVNSYKTASKQFTMDIQ